MNSVKNYQEKQCLTEKKMQNVLIKTTNLSNVIHDYNLFYIEKIFFFFKYDSNI